MHSSLGPGVVREVRTAKAVLVRFRSEYGRPYSAIVHPDALQFIARAVRDQRRTRRSSRDPNPGSGFLVQRFTNGRWVTAYEERDLVTAHRRRASLRAAGYQARVREKGTGTPRDPDPPEKRKRPYERYAATKMSKLALRRLARQSIRRPDVAQGPLHDALLEMYAEDYTKAIDFAEARAKLRRSAASDRWVGDYAVMFNPSELAVSRPSRFWIIQYDAKDDQGWEPSVITYIARRRQRKTKS